MFFVKMSNTPEQKWLQKNICGEKINYCLTFIAIQETPDKNFTKIKNVGQKYYFNCMN